jgi:eukaryotic-like serine/threonine-protein kinase
MAHPQQRYRVLEKIASGGMAEVFRAESAGLEGFKKTVAIKRVLPHLSEKKQFIGMFLDEARLSAHLSHSNCVQVFDIGVGDNTYFIVMEFVDGADLKAVIENQKKSGQSFPIEEACLICVRICEGLAYAHELIDGTGQNIGIVHRDMSPPNVLITAFGEVKIVDFGLAKANSQLEHSEPGIIKGKFSYLSPEAALGHPVDARTDIFAVGIILWELLAGRRLFIGESDLETVRQVQSARVPPIRTINPYASLELEAVLAKALARDPEHRYQMARDLGHDLNQILFQCGRAVSSFDIAALVEPVRRERAAQRQRKVDKGSIIGSLIDEALFEFTSLDRDSTEEGGEMGARPLNIGTFENVQDWASDMSDLGGYTETAEQRAALPSERFELGNLAALEDDSPSARRQRAVAPPTSSEVPAPSSVPPSVHVPPPAMLPTTSAPPPSPRPAQQSQRSGGKGSMIALLVLVLIVVGVAGAYFSGLLRVGMR